jgi:hypothetical protein
MKLPFKERMTDKEYISYLELENKFLKDKLFDQTNDLNESYNKGLEVGYNEALKEFSKKD